MNSKTNQTIFVIDNDSNSTASLAWLLESMQFNVIVYNDPEKFLGDLSRVEKTTGCILMDARLPNLSGLALQKILIQRNIDLPVIFVSQHASIETTAQAMQAGAKYFFTKPPNEEKLLEVIHFALEQNAEEKIKLKRIKQLKKQFSGLTAREQQILNLIFQGFSNKRISENLHLSIKTVEFHRANLMRKTQVASVVDLVKNYQQLQLFDIQPA